MSKKVYIHIGFHKTGTTTAQVFFNENRERLREAGVIYPQSMSPFPAHQDLAWSILPARWQDRDYDYNEVRDHYAACIEQLGDGERLLISSEDFSLFCRKDGATQQLADIFQGTDVNIIAFLREPKSAYISRYLHALMATDLTHTFEEYVLDKPGNFFYVKQLNPFRDTFGLENLQTIIYQGNSIHQLLDIIGVDPSIQDQLVVPKNVNVGMHVWLIDTAIRINHLDLPSDKKKSLKHTVSDLLSEEFPKVDREAYLWSSKLIQKTNKLRNQQMNILRREYGIEFD